MEDLGQHAVGKAAADIPRVQQPSLFVVIAGCDGAEGGDTGALAGRVPADYKLLLVDNLHFDPVAAAGAGFVTGVKPLADDTFEADRPRRCL